MVKMVTIHPGLWKETVKKIWVRVLSIIKKENS